VAAAQDRVDQALTGYAALTLRAPTPGYLLEYADLLRSVGRDAQADTQLRLAAASHQLFTGNGGIDGLTGVALAAADPATALAQAQAEWARRQHSDVADALAWALHLSHQDNEAITYARRALATGARSAAYRYHLGLIELTLGDRAAAATDLAEALAINPNFSPLDAPAARRALAELRS
jgi:tetratricopeptide (TPR) repeat protein